MPSPETIIASVAAVTGVPVGAITGRHRPHEVSVARFLAIAGIRRIHTWLTLRQVGKLFRRDHTSIVHASKRHRALLSTDPHYVRLWNQVVQDIHQP